MHRLPRHRRCGSLRNCPTRANAPGLAGAVAGVATAGVETATRVGTGALCA